MMLYLIIKYPSKKIHFVTTSPEAAYKKVDELNKACCKCKCEIDYHWSALAWFVSDEIGGFYE